MDAVSHLLVERRAAAAGLDRMLGWSAVAHVAPLALVALVPAGWLGLRMDGARENVITLEMHGTAGPPDGGMTATPSRPIQRLRDVEARKAIEPRRPAAAAVPEMIEPTKATPKMQERPLEMRVPDMKSKTPTTGEELRNGTAVANTKAPGEAPGLTFGADGTGGQLDVGDFCCPEYVVMMQDLINRNWESKQAVAGITVMKFTIERDGRLTGVQREKSSGQPTLDYLSERALLQTRQLPPLPAAYAQPSLTVHLTFEYYR